MPNDDMVAAWDGPFGEVWAAHAEAYESSGRAYRARLLTAAAIGGAERVLDVGCGNGGTTLAAARATTGDVLGVDLSTAMLEVARRRASEAGLANVRFERADAQVHAFEPGSFDVAISSFGVMFFDDPVAAFANVRSALAPGGRLAVLVWREASRNDCFRVPYEALAGAPMPAPEPGAPGPASLADEGRVREVLGAAGWSDVALDAVDEPIDYGPDADSAMAFLGGHPGYRAMAAEWDDETRERAFARLRAEVEARVTGEGVLFAGSAWLVTARA